MLQKITSWFRVNLNQKNSSTLYSKFLNLKQTIQIFYQNHPRLGGGINISLIIFLIMVGSYLWNLAPPKIGSKDFRIFNVPYGVSLREIGRTLAKGEFIRNKFVFEIYVRLSPKKRMAKAGYYRLSPGMTVPQIVRELRRGIPPTVRITIPEGLTIKETSELLARNGLVNRDYFMNQARDLNFVNEVLGNYQIESVPEGYLFPDTYNFELTKAPEKEILRKMLLRFKGVFQENFGKVSASRWREVVIIASLVEKEARKAEERPIIAGIFYNRLRLGYPLQSCATVQYALGKRKERLYYKDLQVNSPYNTYLHQGLPPGPIANPGLASLKAAALPAKVSYLYFVAKPDGTHIFSNTLRQHLNAQHKIEKGNISQQIMN